MLYEDPLLSLPADSLRRRFRNDPVRMRLLDLFKSVVHGIVLVVRYLRFVLGIVELCKMVELLYEFKIFILLLISLSHARKQI